MNRKVRNFTKYCKDYLKVRHAVIYPKNYGPKIFCVGFNKTGTSSLGRSLRELGFRHATYNKVIWKDYYLKGKIDKILSFTARFESFDDLPWLKEDMIPLLDKTFPGSKFIYLTREEDQWKKSLYNWTYKKKGEYPDVEKEVENFKAHSEFIESYFKDWNSEQYIVLDIKDPQGYKKLAKFVGVTTTRESFPHFNKSKTPT